MFTGRKSSLNTSKYTVRVFRCAQKAFATRTCITRSFRELSATHRNTRTSAQKQCKGTCITRSFRELSATHRNTRTLPVSVHRNRQSTCISMSFRELSATHRNTRTSALFLCTRTCFSMSFREFSATHRNTRTSAQKQAKYVFTGRKSSLNTSKYTYECTETGKVRVYRSQKLSKHIEIHVPVHRNRQSTCLQVAKAL